MSPLVWTRETPKEAGWWWARLLERPDAPPCVLYVTGETKQEKMDRMMAMGWPPFDNGDLMFPIPGSLPYFRNYEHCEWCGPIPPPPPVVTP